MINKTSDKEKRIYIKFQFVIFIIEHLVLGFIIFGLISVKDQLGTPPPQIFFILLGSIVFIILSIISIANGIVNFKRRKSKKLPVFSKKNRFFLFVFFLNVIVILYSLAILTMFVIYM